MESNRIAIVLLILLLPWPLSPHTMTSVPDWEREFDKARPEQSWMPKQISKEEQSEVRPFGYKYFSNGNVHEVTDWGHIKSFIRDLLTKADQEGYARGFEKGKQEGREEAYDYMYDKVNEYVGAQVDYDTPPARTILNWLEAARRGTNDTDHET
jgi:hypothetical protein